MPERDLFERASDVIRRLRESPLGRRAVMTIRDALFDLPDHAFYHVLQHLNRAA